MMEATVARLIGSLIRQLRTHKTRWCCTLETDRRSKTETPSRRREEAETEWSRAKGVEHRGRCWEWGTSRFLWLFSAWRTRAHRVVGGSSTERTAAGGDESAPASLKPLSEADNRRSDDRSEANSSSSCGRKCCCWFWLRSTKEFPGSPIATVRRSGRKNTVGVRLPNDPTRCDCGQNQQITPVDSGGQVIRNGQFTATICCLSSSFGRTTGLLRDARRTRKESDLLIKKALLKST